MQRKAIYNVHYNSRHEAIFVAVGHEGIDIYEVRLGYADHIKTIGGALLGFQEGEYRIIDVDSNPEETILYVLEAERGLLFYDISNLNAIVSPSLLNDSLEKTQSNYRNIQCQIIRSPSKHLLYRCKNTKYAGLCSRSLCRFRIIILLP